MSTLDSVPLKLPLDFLNRQLGRTNYLLSFSSLLSSAGLRLKISSPFVALRGGDDEVFTRSVL